MMLMPTDFYALQGNSTIYGIIFLLLFTVVWKWFYHSFCKLFAKNQPRSQKQIATLLQHNMDFVLFLRPFSHDKELEKYTNNSYDPFIGFNTDYLTAEEQLSNAFADFGIRTVAIADNKTINAYLGYERYLADNETWKQTVTTLIEKAKFICLYGNGKGEFQWELEQVNKLQCTQKCIVFYPDSKREFELFLKSYETLQINMAELLTGIKYFNESSFFGGIVYYNRRTEKFSSFSFSKVKANLRHKGDMWPRINTFLKNEEALELAAVKPITTKTYLFSLLADWGILLLWWILSFADIDGFPLLSPMVLYLFFGIVPGNLIFRLKLRDKSGCQANLSQVFTRKLILIICLLIPVFGLAYLINVLLASLINKRLYLPHEAYSGTALFQKR